MYSTTCLVFLKTLFLPSLFTKVLTNVLNYYVEVSSLPFSFEAIFCMAMENENLWIGSINSGSVLKNLFTFASVSILCVNTSPLKVIRHSKIRRRLRTLQKLKKWQVHSENEVWKLSNSFNIFWQFFLFFRNQQPWKRSPNLLFCFWMWKAPHTSPEWSDTKKWGKKGKTSRSKKFGIQTKRRT